MINKTVLLWLIAASMLLATTGNAQPTRNGQRYRLSRRVGGLHPRWTMGTLRWHTPGRRTRRGGCANCRALSCALRPLRASDTGPATYRAKNRIDGALNSSLAIYLPAFSGVVAAYVNGRLLYDKARDPTAPPLLLFDASNGAASLVLQVGPGEQGLEEASFFPSFVVFGEAQAVYRSWLGLGLAIALQDGFFILAGLFVLILFFSWKKNRDFFAFSLYLLIVGLSRGLEGSSLFLGLPLALGKRALEIAHFASIDLQYLALGFFLRSIFADRIRRGAALPFYALFVALAAVDVAFPSLIGPLSLIGEASYLLFGLCSIVFLAVTAARGVPQARWLLPAFFVVPVALAIRSRLRDLVEYILARRRGYRGLHDRRAADARQEGGIPSNPPRPYPVYVDSVSRTVKISSRRNSSNTSIRPTSSTSASATTPRRR